VKVGAPGRTDRSKTTLRNYVVFVSVISLRALKADKSETREDPLVTAKDRADLATLSRFS
jgi:hypothetical protein